MILKKPYAFFIKMFKPIHLLLDAFVLYLIYLSNDILKFLNNYIYSSETLANGEVINSLINNYFYIIPIILIVFFILLLSIMYKKNKPVLFYFVGIFSFIVVLVINIYTINFLKVLLESIVSVKLIKLIHDLVLINIILESISFIFLFVRGLGIDFKKFDFGADISKFEISESDKEEFEVNINIDFNEKKRKRKEKFRNLKYLYVENKFLINLLVIISICIMTFFIIYFVNKNNQINKEGIYYSNDSFIIKVNSSTILNTDYKGNKITDNYLIIVDVNIKSNYSNKKLYLNDFSLKIENAKFKPTQKYNNYLIDLGNFYNEEMISLEYTDYLFVYEIPKKYMESEMLFSYNSEGHIIDILLDPQKLNNTEVSETKNINEALVFDGVLSGVGFEISDYALSNKFFLEYNYCIQENDCILSKEYLKASIDENYDKVVLKLNVNYNSESNLGIDTFYALLSKFGSISYKINDTWISAYKFEEIKSKRIYHENVTYIGINSNIMNANSIKIVFDVRGLKYEYILK